MGIIIIIKNTINEKRQKYQKITNKNNTEKNLANQKQKQKEKKASRRINEFKLTMDALVVTAS